MSVYANIAEKNFHADEVSDRYFIPLGLGPAFLTASIYLTLGRIVVVYGERFSRFLPRTYTLVFVSCDILSLCVQAVGGALTSSAETDNARQTGVDILISGLTFQAFSLALFFSLCAEFAMRVRKADSSLRDPRFESLRATPRFKLFIYGGCFSFSPLCSHEAGLTSSALRASD